MLQFLGRFHPVLVHLPIGILLVACFFQWLTINEKYKILQPSLPILFLCGMLSAIASCVSGYLLSITDDYDVELINLHQWMGISVAALSVAAYFLQKNNSWFLYQRILSFILLIIILITGHLGGSLTHGPGYLSFENDSANIKAGTPKPIAPIPDVQEAIAYKAIVQPVLERKCYSCHGTSKQKGGLRMDDIALFIKGGKHGIIFTANDPDKSEMIKRLLIASEVEHHMPPKEKPQLTEKEIKLLQWWIASGASFEKKVKELDQPEKMKPILVSLQNVNPASEKKIDLPEIPVDKAPEAAISQLKNAGVIVVPVSKNSNYLTANFVNTTVEINTAIKLLLPLKKQLFELKLSGKKATDTDMQVLAQCTAIQKLFLDNTLITDNGLSQLQKLISLQYLNLVNTKITGRGLMTLKNLKKLQVIYLYQTAVTKADWENLVKSFPHLLLDSGGYVVNSLPADTSVLKQAIKKL